MGTNDTAALVLHYRHESLAAAAVQLHRHPDEPGRLDALVNAALDFGRTFDETTGDHTTSVAHETSSPTPELILIPAGDDPQPTLGDLDDAFVAVGFMYVDVDDCDVTP